MNYSDNLSSQTGKRIRAERRRRHLTQEAFAELLGISTSYLGAIERGKRAASRQLLIKIHDTLNLPYDYLLEGKNIYQQQNAHNMLREEPGSYQVRRNMSLMLGSCSTDEIRECYDLIHTYLNYVRSGHNTGPSSG